MKKRAIILCISLLVIGIAVAILLFPPTPITMWSQNVGAQEQQRVIEIEIDPNVAKAAIEAANRYTGLNELQNVWITVERAEIKENEDDSPIAAIHSRIVGRPLIRVTYTASLPEWQGKKNSYIQAFDVLLDAKDLSLLKIASRWTDNIDIKYKEGAKRIRKEAIAPNIPDHLMDSNELPKEFPKERPFDMLRKGPGEHIDNKHMEWYYVTLGKENTPVWFLIAYGGHVRRPSIPPLVVPEPISWPPPSEHVAKCWLGNALTGAGLMTFEIVY